MAAIDSIFPTDDMGTIEAARRSFANQPADVQNALTEQRNEVAALVANSEDLRDLKAAERAFRLVVTLWHAVGYGYKVPETRARLARRAAELARDFREMANDIPTRKHAARGRLFKEADELDTYAASL